MTHERLTHEVHRRSLPRIYNVLTIQALVICSRLSITAVARRNCERENRREALGRRDPKGYILVFVSVSTRRDGRVTQDIKTSVGVKVL